MTREGRDEREKSSSLKKNVFFFFRGAEARNADPRVWHLSHEINAK